MNHTITMENKLVYIFGGAGSIGSELTRQLSEKNRVRIFDIDETRMFDLVEELRLEGREVKGYVLDVRNIEELKSYVEKNEYPNLVINCAARKHVTPMEQTPMEAVSVNIEGTYNLIGFCSKFGAKLINISTDKVVNADCVMGATKKVAELMVKNAGFTSVRFGNVMGSRGSVIPIWQKQMNEGKPLTITDEHMERYMMTIEQACSLVIEVAQMEDVKGKVVILDMGEPVRILDLAKKILGKEDGYRIIGIRPGEKLSERLMSEDEEKRAEKRGKFYII